MRRRTFITLLGGSAAVWPLAARAQQPKVPTIGALVIGNISPDEFWREFRQGLRDLGYIEGQNIRFEFRSAEGQINRLPELAAELVRLKVDVIVTWFTPTAVAAKQATREIPIVMAETGDPIGTGLIMSLPRPGGNVTGIGRKSTNGRRPRNAKKSSDNFAVPRNCKRGRAARLRAGRSASFSPGRSHGAQGFARRKGRRVASGAADTIPARGELEDREAFRHHAAALDPAASRRGDRIKRGRCPSLAHRVVSLRCQRSYAIRGKADIARGCRSEAIDPIGYRIAAIA